MTPNELLDAVDDIIAHRRTLKSYARTERAQIADQLVLELTQRERENDSLQLQVELLQAQMLENVSYIGRIRGIFESYDASHPASTSGHFDS